MTYSQGSSTFMHTDTHRDTISSRPDSLYYDSQPVHDSPEYIPETHTARKLILCFDGTGDQFDEDNSNIIEFFHLLKKDDQEQQMVYYQAGIGTYTAPHFASRLTANISKWFDEAIAWNLRSHVMGGYEFLMQNYKHGDKICIFGFSRGAYTARSLAGMIHKVGIIPAWNFQQVPFSWKMYTREDEIGWVQSTKFKDTFSSNAEIEFIGVWDTVNSVGLIPRRLPFTTSNTIVRTFRHAMALDEHRVKFKARLWNSFSPKDDPKRFFGKAKLTKLYEKRFKELKKREERYASMKEHLTNVKEVWFAGGHCDVGGGSVPNETRANLARIPLRWMVRECFKANTGIMFDVDRLEKIGLDSVGLIRDPATRPQPLPLGNSHTIQSIPKRQKEEEKISEERCTIPEEELERADALSPIYDQLSLKKQWWILEALPFMTSLPEKDKKHLWERLGCNWGRGRIITVPEVKGDTVKIHRSVKIRMCAEGKKKYIPKARFGREGSASRRDWSEKDWETRNKVEWVD